MSDPNTYPPGWDNERVQQMLEHYESQSDEDAAREDDVAMLALRGQNEIRPKRLQKPTEIKER